MENVLHLMYGDHLARDDIVRMADAQFQNEQRSLSQIYNLVYVYESRFLWITREDN